MSSERHRFFAGIDLGQVNDATAICVARRIEKDGAPVEQSTIEVGHLERLPLGTTYPAVVERVRWLMQHPNVAGNIDLTLDATGVGRPICDLVAQAGIPFVGIIITSGNQESNPDGGKYWHVPKITLISFLQALLHGGRLKIRSDLPETGALVEELKDFRVEYSAAGHMSYNARSGRHDDLVLALSLAVWRAMRPLSGAEGWLEYYRRLNEAAGVNTSKFGYDIAPEAQKTHRVRVPEGVSTIYLIDGTSKLVPADRIVEVSKVDAIAVGRRGWERPD